MKKSKRTYDDNFRSSAILFLETAGYPHTRGALEQVSKKINVPARTLSRWFNGEQNPPPDRMVSDKKNDLVIELEDIAYMLVKAVPGKIDDAGLQQVTTSLAIAIDKMQLLKGSPTQITKDVSLTDEERTNRITALFDRARARRTGQTVDSEGGNQTWPH